LVSSIKICPDYPDDTQPENNEKDYDKHQSIRGDQRSSTDAVVLDLVGNSSISLRIYGDKDFLYLSQPIPDV